MNSKNIKRHLKAKIKDWTDSITDEKVRKLAQDNVIVTGGALVSLLTGEPVHDYDVYFRTKEACVAVANYYIDMANNSKEFNRTISLVVEEDKTEKKRVILHPGQPFSEENSKEIDVKVPGRVKVWVQSEGVSEQKTQVADDQPFPPVEVDEEEQPEETTEDNKPKYRPKFFSSNAITLSDKIQVITRFYGEVEEIHKNYDFVHCTCSWTSWDNSVQLPAKALECIINKELVYVGSRYPLCSIIRTRKYIKRGYHINAGQYVKMAFQLNELNLNDIETLEEQLTGVDSGYFAILVEALKDKMEKDNTQKVDNAYVMELINRIF